MALIQCTCSYCEHEFFRVTTPCEWQDGKTYPTFSCPLCHNTLLDIENITPDAHTECPGCSSNCGSSLEGKSGCSGCSSAGGCGIKDALAAKS